MGKERKDLEKNLSEAFSICQENYKNSLKNQCRERPLNDIELVGKLTKAHRHLVPDQLVQKLSYEAPMLQRSVSTCRRRSWGGGWII